MHTLCPNILHEPSAPRRLPLQILNTLFCEHKQDNSRACFLSRHCLLEKQCRDRQNRGDIFLFCRSFYFSCVVCRLLKHREPGPLGQVSDKWLCRNKQMKNSQFFFEYSLLNLFVLHIELAVHASNMTFIRKTEITVVPYNQMFMNGYAHYLAGKNELTCYGEIIRGRLGVA